jgi:hypothetical protein
MHFACFAAAAICSYSAATARGLGHIGARAGQSERHLGRPMTQRRAMHADAAAWLGVYVGNLGTAAVRHSGHRALWFGVLRSAGRLQVVRGPGQDAGIFVYGLPQHASFGVLPAANASAHCAGAPLATDVASAERLRRWVLIQQLHGKDMPSRTMGLSWMLFPGAGRGQRSFDCRIYGIAWLQAPRLAPARGWDSSISCM